MVYSHTSSLMTLSLHTFPLQCMSVTYIHFVSKSMVSVCSEHSVVISPCTIDLSEIFLKDFSHRI